MEIRVTGDKEIALKLKKFTSTAERNLFNAIQEGAFLVEGDAKRSMRGGGRPHVPSRPGQPPAVHFDKLRASITTDVVKTTSGEIVGKVGVEGGSDPDTKNYGLYLEIGTSKIRKRPFLLPAYIKNIGAIKEKIRRAIKRAVA